MTIHDTPAGQGARGSSLGNIPASAERQKIVAYLNINS
jgi:hypothetical protein